MRARSKMKSSSATDMVNALPRGLTDDQMSALEWLLGQIDDYQQPRG
jgi:hypothetical protein